MLSPAPQLPTLKQKNEQREFLKVSLEQKVAHPKGQTSSYKTSPGDTVHSELTAVNDTVLQT